MLLLELFDKTSPIRWARQVESGPNRVWQGFFFVENEEFEINIQDFNGRAWVEFANIKSDYDPVNTLGIKAGIVFATVLEAVHEYIAAHKPERLRFSSDNDVGLTSIYRKLLKREQSRLSSLGYDFEIQTPSTYTTVFVLNRRVNTA